MKDYLFLAPCLFAAVGCAQSAKSSSLDHISEQEIKAAVDAQPGSGFVLIEDAGFATPSLCQAQVPSEAIYTPAGWVNAVSQLAKRQYLSFVPTNNDTQKALTVISAGCASGTPAGPVCNSITRVVLVPDAGGSTVLEATTTYPLGSTWQNGYGARTACTSLVSKFRSQTWTR